MSSSEIQKLLEERPLSYSSLKQFAYSPKSYIHYLTAEKETTSAQVFGQILDCLILTPNEFESRYFVIDDEDICTQIGGAKPRATNRYKEWMAETKAEAGNKFLINKDEFDKAKSVQESVNSNQVATEYLSRVSRTQISFTWKEKESGLPFISKVDGEADKFILELKTTKDASPQGFIRECLNYDYDLQSATYLEGYKRKFFKFPYYVYLAVETSEPYNVSVFKATDDYLAYGLQRFKKLAMQFKYCLEKDFWNQSYEFHSINGYHDLELPGYLKRDLE